MAHIWIIEDDPYDIAGLAAYFQATGLGVTVFESESEFRDNFRQIAVTNPPIAVLIDIMVPWSRHDDPNPAIAPPECSEMQEAGVRCRDLLASDVSTFTARRIYYTLGGIKGITLGPGDAVFMKQAGHRDVLAYVEQLLQETEASSSLDSLV